MGNVLILNGSPRAPKSNSRQYAEIFSTNCQLPSDYFNISKNNHAELCRRMSEYSDVLLVFPLYADSLPVGFLNFLKHLEANPPERKPVVSILINCGFLEHQQNDIALKMLRFFCRKNGYRMGSVLALGSGEAILGTVPLRSGQSGQEAGEICRKRELPHDTGYHAAEQTLVSLGCHVLLDLVWQAFRNDQGADADHED